MKESWNAPSDRSVVLDHAEEIVAECGTAKIIQSMRQVRPYLSDGEIAKIIGKRLNLIAAAPELLEACKAALGLLLMIGDDNGVGPPDVAKRMEAAIHKAEERC
jgi:hypothetical protein